MRENAFCMVFHVRWISHYSSPNPTLVATRLGRDSETRGYAFCMVFHVIWMFLTHESPNPARRLILLRPKLPSSLTVTKSVSKCLNVPVTKYVPNYLNVPVTKYVPNYLNVPVTKYVCNYLNSLSQNMSITI